MAVPPVTLNLLQLLPSDDQQTIIDKSNYNWDQVLSLGGGPPGIQGVQGIQGLPGVQGIQGFQGIPGTPGSKWYVQPTTPSTSPAPSIGDFWFNTATLDVLEWDGASWNITGSLSISGVFKEATGDSDRIIFGSPTPLKSLVLSPINYGVGAPTGGTYKLKLIGTSGTSIMNFGVVESGNVESPIAKQTYISVNTVTPNNKYDFNLVNPSGSIEFSAFGTALRLNEQSGGTSNYDFNGTSLKLQINATNRNFGFSNSFGSNIGMHFGLQDALTNGASRGLSIIDQSGLGAFWPLISLRNAAGNSVIGDTSNKPIFLDSRHPQLSDNTTTLPEQTFWRFRHVVGGGKVAWSRMTSKRLFNDPGNGTNPERSMGIFIEGGLDSSTWNFLSFVGGAQSSANGSRPQLRMGTGSNSHFSLDVNGYFGIGTDSFIKTYNSTIDATKQFKTLFNMEAPSGASTGVGDTAYAGSHIYLNTSNGYGGFTAGAGANSHLTHAGILFRDNGNGVDVNIGSGNFTTPSGTQAMRTRLVIDSDGIIKMAGRDNLNATVKNQQLTFDIISDNATVSSNDTLGDGGSGMLRNIILQSSTDVKTDSISGQVGGGFVGIGDMSTFTLSTAQTKFHVKGAATFGSRFAVNNYASDVSVFDNWTFGDSHRNSANRGLILGSAGHTIAATATDSVIIGGDGTNPRTITSPNVIAAVTKTFVGTGTPFFTSLNPTFTKDNNLSVRMDGTGNFNGIETLYTFNSLSGPFNISQSAAFLLTNEDNILTPSVKATKFVVRGDGKTAITSDVVSTVDPGTTSGQIWSASPATNPVLNLGLSLKSDLVLGTPTPSILAPTLSQNSVISTVSYTGNVGSANKIRGKHLLINPGVVRNVNTGLGTGAQGGDLYLRGGKGESNALSVINPDAYGNVRLVQDAGSPSANAGAVSVGVGTPFNAVYLGKISVNKVSNGNFASTLIHGTDYAGTSYALSTVGTIVETQITVTLPTPFVNTNIVCLAQMDASSPGHWPWKAFCSGRTANTVVITVVRTDGGVWNNGIAVEFSFMAYCLP